MTKSAGWSPTHWDLLNSHHPELTHIAFTFSDFLYESEYQLPSMIPCVKRKCHIKMFDTHKNYWNQRAIIKFRNRVSKWLASRQLTSGSAECRHLVAVQ